MTKRQDRYAKLLDVPGVRAQAVAEKAGVPVSAIRAMKSGKQRWSGPAMRAARDVARSVLEASASAVAACMSGRDADEVFLEMPVTRKRGARLLRVTAHHYEGTRLIALRDWEPAGRTFGVPRPTTAGVSSSEDTWRRLLLPALEKAVAAGEADPEPEEIDGEE